MCVSPRPRSRSAPRPPSHISAGWHLLLPLGGSPSGSALAFRSEPLPAPTPLPHRTGGPLATPLPRRQPYRARTSPLPATADHRLTGPRDRQLSPAPLPAARQPGSPPPHPLRLPCGSPLPRPRLIAALPVCRPYLSRRPARLPPLAADRRNGKDCSAVRPGLPRLGQRLRRLPPDKAPTPAARCAARHSRAPRSFRSTLCSSPTAAGVRRAVSQLSH